MEEIVIFRSAISDSFESIATSRSPQINEMLEAYRIWTFRFRNDAEFIAADAEIAAVVGDFRKELAASLGAYQRMIEQDLDGGGSVRGAADRAANMDKEAAEKTAVRMNEVYQSFLPAIMNQYGYQSLNCTLVVC